MSQNYDSSKGSDAFILCSVIGLIGIYFFFQHNYHLIVYVWKTIRLIEMGIFYWIPDWLPFYGKLEIKKAVTFLVSTPAVDIMPITVQRFDRYYLHWFSVIPGLIMFYWGVKRFLNTGGVSTRYDMESMLTTFADMYPNLKEYINNNPADKPVIYKRNQKETHRWSMPISPVDYSTVVPPYGLEQKAKTDSSYKMPIWDGEDGFDENLAELSFKAQLGRHYKGVDELFEYERRVFDEFTSKLSVNNELKMEWFVQVASHVLKAKGSSFKEKGMGLGMAKLLTFIKDEIGAQTNGKVNFDKSNYISESTVAKKVANEKNSALQSIFKLILAEKIMSSHAYVRCGFMQLMEKARDSGVLASSAFKWVKQFDRCLWNCLSSVGRKTPHTEAAGCFAHWVIERQLDRPLYHPEVTEAVNGLRKALWLDKTE